MVLTMIHFGKKILSQISLSALKSTSNPMERMEKLISKETCVKQSFISQSLTNSSKPTWMLSKHLQRSNRTNSSIRTRKEVCRATNKKVRIQASPTSALSSKSLCHRARRNRHLQDRMQEQKRRQKHFSHTTWYQEHLTLKGERHNFDTKKSWITS